MKHKKMMILSLLVAMASSDVFAKEQIIAKIDGISITREDVEFFEKNRNSDMNKDFSTESKTVFTFAVSQSMLNDLGEEYRSLETNLKNAKNTKDKFDIIDEIFFKWENEYNKKFSKEYKEISEQEISKFYDKINTKPYFELTIYAFENIETANEAIKSLKEKNNLDFKKNNIKFGHKSSGSIQFLKKVNTFISEELNEKSEKNQVSNTPKKGMDELFYIWKIDEIDKTEKKQNYASLDDQTKNMIKIIYSSEKYSSLKDKSIIQKEKNINIKWEEKEPDDFKKMINSIEN